MYCKEKNVHNINQFYDDRNKSYTTAELIINLKNELQNCPNELAEANCSRKQGYKDYWLSELWGFSKKYVYVLKKKMKDDINFIINPNALLKLKENLSSNLSENQIIRCLELIELYENGKLSGLDLLDLLKLELGKVSCSIPVTFEELGFILTGSTRFITAVWDKIHNNYPEYKFTKERIEEFKKSIVGLLGQKATRCLSFIENYKKLNPNLKLYFNQQFHIENYDFFKDMEKKRKVANFYWFGFLCADGWLIGETNEKNYYRIGIELSSKDKELIYKFSRVIGLEIKRIKKRIRYLKNRNGKLNKHLMVYVIFGCKPMFLDLIELGMRKITSKVNPKLKKIPPIINILIKKAKFEDPILDINSNPIKWYYTPSGKLALAWLLGFYDGDGHYAGGRSASITSSSIHLLEQIKDNFDIKNQVRIYPKSNSLQIGPNLFDALMWAYNESLERKRKKI